MSDQKSRVLQCTAAAYEMVERKTADNSKDRDISFLQPLTYDLVNCIDILDRYRDKQ